MESKTIQDEFTGKGTKVWRYAQRHLRDGLCQRCGKRAVYAGYCVEHRMKKTAEERRWARAQGKYKHSVKVLEKRRLLRLQNGL